MMLAISLMRMGSKGKPFYRLVVKEKRSKRDGKYLENVGTYDPMQDPAEVKLNHDRIQYWIGVGAQPTDTVKSLIKNNPILTEEERDAMLAARAEKKAAAEAERAAARKAEADRIAAEAAEKEAAEKAAAAEEAASADAEATVAEEAPAAEESAPVEAATEEVAAAEEAPTAEEAPAEEEAAA
ncbi:MAG: 30S ribosomal protein S16 [Blastocatellia bacterium]|nr:30S ribosomal protein S16 [Blastocatellia bacterium]